MEGLLIIFIAIAVVATAAVLFVCWAVIAIIKGIVKLFLPSTYRKPASPGLGGVQTCTNMQCRCQNPGHARFCRRCGKSLPNLLRIAGTRAA